MNADVSDLVGKVLLRIDQKEDELVFICSTGEKYKMYHSQECIESVNIEDICGDLNDLLGTPILKAEEVSNEKFLPNFETYAPESFTYTFYKIATIKGYVDIRWFGESNGHYSESVNFQKADKYGEFPYLP